MPSLALLMSVPNLLADFKITCARANRIVQQTSCALRTRSYYMIILKCEHDHNFRYCQLSMSCRYGYNIDVICPLVFNQCFVSQSILPEMP